MHTILVVGGGLTLLAAFILVSRLLTRGDRTAMARAAILFVPVWLICSAVNMAIGVVQAGYTVMEELPFFAAVFGVPALAAFVIYWTFGRDR